MLPLIIEVAVVTISVVILKETESEKEHTRKRYRDVNNMFKENIQKEYNKAQKKETLDKLYKVKRAKQKIAKNLYRELKMTKGYFKKINIRIKNSKEKLSSLFEEKRLATTKEKRIKIQKNINLLQEARIELFDIKNGLKIDIDRFQSKLKKVNKEIKDIYTEIKRI